MKSKGKAKARDPRPDKEAKVDQPPNPQERPATPQITTYDTINKTVHEYLLKSGLFKTVDAFQVRRLSYALVARIALWEVHDRQLHHQHRRGPQLRTLLHAGSESFRYSQSYRHLTRGRRTCSSSAGADCCQCTCRVMTRSVTSWAFTCECTSRSTQCTPSILKYSISSLQNGDISKLHRELEEFKGYLDAERESLAQIPEFLPFYALPFTTSPQVAVGQDE